MSDYIEPCKRFIKSATSSYADGCEPELSFHNDKKESSLRVTPYKAVFNGYIVPLDESEIEDLYIFSSVSHSKAEESRKKEALKKLLNNE